MSFCRHEAARELFPAAALDALSVQERAQAAAHLLLCEECARELDDLSGTAAELAHLAFHPASDELRLRRIRHRLLARAAADRPISARRLVGQADGARHAWLQGGGWLTAATLAGLLLTHHTFHQPLDFGWVASSALGGVAVGMLFYLRRLRERLRALETRASRLDELLPPPP